MSAASMSNKHRLGDGYEARIADDWIFSHSSDAEIAGYRDPLFIIEVIMDGSWATGWHILMQIVERDREEVTLDELACGPFESWMSRYGNEHIETIETWARDSGRLRRVLREIPRSGALDDETWQRIEKARAAN